MTKEELALKIYEVAHIRGEFLLRSGQISKEYFDKYQFESRPDLLHEISNRMLDLVPQGTEILGGLEMGGIPIATSISLTNKIPTIFVRKEAKEYGTRKLAEGIDFAGKRVCIIEDVVTTGGQIILSAEELRSRGAIVENVLCVIVRDPKAFDNLNGKGLKLIPLFTMEEIKEIAE
jgi:orotate phosphoribosyltransferase